MIFVSGITGRVGGSAARRLLDAGRRVRALVREPSKARVWADEGVEIIAGDLTDPDAVARAFDGVEAAFIMEPTPIGVTPEFPEACALIVGIEGGLRRAPPPRVVILSSVGSERSHGLGNITQTRLLEQALADIASAMAMVRAGAYLENNIASLKRAGETGWFDSFLQPSHHAFPMAATADIGAEVARLLTEGWDGHRLIIELGSRYTPDDLAAAMGEALGREVKARPIPRDAWDATFGAMGLPEHRRPMWAEMQDGFNSGWIDFGRPGAKAVAGTTPPAQVFARALASQAKR